jgi:hypothetical protein
VEVAATSRGIAVDTASLAASQPHSRRGWRRRVPSASRSRGFLGEDVASSAAWMRNASMYRSVNRGKRGAGFGTCSLGRTLHLNHLIRSLAIIVIWSVEYH